MYKSLVFSLAVTMASTCHASSPCDGITRTFTTAEKAAVAPAIAKQLQLSSVDVLQSFQLGNWSVIYVGTHQSDNAFLFYSHDPRTSRYVTLWGGAAQSDEEQAIEDWTVKNAHGIPLQLAKCFAWHVTKDRGQ
jgi:hypothetical protein